MKNSILAAAVLAAALSATGADACSVVASGPLTNRVYQVGDPSGADDTAAMQCALDAAATGTIYNGVTNATVLYSAGKVYRTRGVSNEWSALHLRTLNMPTPYFGKITVDGNGSQIVLTAPTAGFYIFGCNTCTLQNITIRYGVSPVAEGTLTASTASTLRFTATSGAAFSLAAGYDTPIGKNDGLVVAKNAYAWAFPDGFMFTAAVPYTHVNHAVATGTTEQLYTDRLPIPLHMAVGTTRITATGAEIDATKQAAVAQRILDTVPPRQQWPGYGPAFFTGQSSTAIAFDGAINPAIRNVTVEDFPGNAVIMNYNRGTCTIDGLVVIPRLTSQSISSVPLGTRGNEQGCQITNSIFVGVGDDGAEINTPAVRIGSLDPVTHKTVIVSTQSNILGSFAIRAGDAVNVVTARGAVKQSNTVATAVPFYFNPSQIWFTVTFRKPLPADADDLLLVNLSRSNTGTLIQNSAFIGVGRVGIGWTSGTRIIGNLFANIAKFAVAYSPYAPDNLPAIGGDCKASAIKQNLIIDVTGTAVRVVSVAGTTPCPAGTLTFAQNSIYAGNMPPVAFTAVENDDPHGHIPISAAANNIYTSAADSRTAPAQFISGTGGAPAAWTSGFKVTQASSAADLWNRKCAAVKANPLWLQAVRIASPGACP